MSCNTVKHFFLAGCWRNKSILPGPGDILRLTDLLARDRLLCLPARDRLLCLPSAAPFPFSSSLARSMALFSSAVCLPACMLSQPDETSSLLSVCLSLAGRFHTTMASCLCNGKASFVLPQPAEAFGALPLLAQLASMCLHAAALPALHTFLHNTLHLPVRVAPPEHHNQSKIH